MKTKQLITKDKKYKEYLKYLAYLKDLQKQDREANKLERENNQHHFNRIMERV